MEQSELKLGVLQYAMQGVVKFWDLIQDKVFFLELDFIYNQ